MHFWRLCIFGYVKGYLHFFKWSVRAHGIPIASEWFDISWLWVAVLVQPKAAIGELPTSAFHQI